MSEMDRVTSAFSIVTFLSGFIQVFGNTTGRQGEAG
jgi:hypothetical protein